MSGAKGLSIFKRISDFWHKRIDLACSKALMTSLLSCSFRKDMQKIAPLGCISYEVLRNFLRGLIFPIGLTSDRYKVFPVSLSIKIMQFLFRQLDRRRSSKSFPPDESRCGWEIEKKLAPSDHRALCKKETVIF